MYRNILILLLIIACTPGKQQEAHTSATSAHYKLLDTAKPPLRWKHKNISLAHLGDSLHIDTNQIKVIITKSAYQLALYRDTMLIKNYPVVFGDNPVDDKLREGDGCTPEGTFGVRSKYPHASWSKFIWIDYPNDDSWKKHKQAKAEGRIPQQANIGGEIGIHGVPSGYDHTIDQKQNWTLGCISMKNKDVNEIYPYITTQTVIEIKK